MFYSTEFELQLLIYLRVARNVWLITPGYYSFSFESLLGNMLFVSFKRCNFCLVAIVGNANRQNAEKLPFVAKPPGNNTI